MERLQRLARHVVAASPAAGAAVLEAEAETADQQPTGWAAKVRQLLAERCPTTFNQAETGYPLLGIDPGDRRHPHDPPPVLYARASGQKMWDVDGNEYVRRHTAALRAALLPPQLSRGRSEGFNLCVFL